VGRYGLLDNLFETTSVETVNRDHFAISEADQARLSQIASLMALLRSKFNFMKEDDGSYSASEPTSESPDRAFRYLEQIAMGSALIDGRFEIMDIDFRLALGVTQGFASPKLRKVANLFFAADFVRTNHDVSLYLKWSPDTAAKYLGQLSELRVIEKVNPDSTIQWDLKPPFKALRRLLFPQNINRLNTKQSAEEKHVPFGEEVMFEFGSTGLTSQSI